MLGTRTMRDLFVVPCAGVSDGISCCLCAMTNIDRGIRRNQPLPPENVGVMVPSQQRSLHAIIAQNLKDTEALIGRLELGVRVADSARGLSGISMCSVEGSARSFLLYCGWSWNRAHAVLR